MTRNTVERIKGLPSAQPETHEKRTETHACDLISRQAAIDAVLRAEALVRAYGYRYAADAVRELPSAQPDIVYCRECRYRYPEGENVVYNMCELNHNKVQPDDWFCADGERSTNE